MKTKIHWLHLEMGLNDDIHVKYGELQTLNVTLRLITCPISKCRNCTGRILKFQFYNFCQGMLESLKIDTNVWNACVRVSKKPQVECVWPDCDSLVIVVMWSIGYWHARGCDQLDQFSRSWHCHIIVHWHSTLSLSQTITACSHTHTFCPLVCVSKCIFKFID